MNVIIILAVVAVLIDARWYRRRRRRIDIRRHMIDLTVKSGDCKKWKKGGVAKWL